MVKSAALQFAALAQLERLRRQESDERQLFGIREPPHFQVPAMKPQSVYDFPAMPQTPQRVLAAASFNFALLEWPQRVRELPQLPLAELGPFQLDALGVTNARP